MANPAVPCRLVRLPSTEAPFLHRHYPASSVIRTSPPPQTAPPALTSCGLTTCGHRWGFPCCVWSPLPACRRHYPGRIDKICPLTVPSTSAFPFPRRVGSCITLFEACSAFTRVTAYMLAESPLRPSPPKAPAASLPPPLLRLLPGGTNQLPGGTCTRCGPTPFHGAPGNLG
jgi:hypothetical protein